MVQRLKSLDLHINILMLLISNNSFDKFFLNKKLIDLNAIPISIINNFNEYYNIIID